ncbi:MAG: tetratricopeptide repeat protein [Coprobacter sp.]|nr:tetratricopeptide repeat protein [Coprobacter sp.]
MNKRFYLLPLLSAVMVMFIGCKKMGELKAEYFTVTPNPLEVIGGEVPATITGQIPEKYFNKKATVVVTPYLVYEGGETAGTPYSYQGEKVVGNDQTISYKMGGTITMKTSFKYIPAMRNSDLYLAFRITQGKKTYELPRVKVAEGVLSTAEICDPNTLTPAIAADKFQRIIKENYQADILFLIQQANLRADELKKAEVQEFQNNLKNAAAAPNKKITGVNISSYASPDGGLELNTKLAENRENATVKYMKGQMKNNNVDADMTAEFTAQDWEGFQQLVAQSNIQDKDLIIRVLSMYKDPEQREQEIKNMSSTFQTLAEEILPKLRYSRISAAIDVIGKSDEEISALAASNPQALTVDELLYAATLTDDLNRKAEIYQKATEIYPNDYRGFNNLGMILFEQGNLSAAETNFKKAAGVNPNSPESQMNLGLIDLTRNELGSAEQAFGKSAGVDELNDALGVLYLQKGDYNKAVRAFGESKTNNAALAQILTKDYNKAKSTLNAVSNPDATTYYLLAIVGARTNNQNDVISNLTKSVQLDRNMAAQAATDIEFAKFNISAIK